MRSRFFYFFIIKFLLTLLLAAAAVMLLWNAVLPGVVRLGPVGYWQALGLLILGRLLFGSLPFAGGHHPLARGWHSLSHNERRKIFDCFGRGSGGRPREWFDDSKKNDGDWHGAHDGRGSGQSRHDCGQNRWRDHHHGGGHHHGGDTRPGGGHYPDGTPRPVGDSRPCPGDRPCPGQGRPDPRGGWAPLDKLEPKDKDDQDKRPSGTNQADDAGHAERTEQTSRTNPAEGSEQTAKPGPGEDKDSGR
ncbi:MAG: hypothetical protein LBO05_09160 [Deltaproteobacteria bacterium]|jgi:hypothetical protein|nr:hypothetical protein [Deltaproteobacteria bacterium]